MKPILEQHKMMIYIWIGIMVLGLAALLVQPTMHVMKKPGSIAAVHHADGH